MPGMTGPLDHLLEQAIAVAREAAIGETAVEPVFVALPDAGPPVPLFIETDEPLSLSQLGEATEAFLAALQVRRWIRIVADLPAEAVVCTAADGDHRATALLRPERDDAGIITAMHDVTPAQPVGVEYGN